MGQNLYPPQTCFFSLLNFSYINILYILPSTKIEVILERICYVIDFATLAPTSELVCHIPFAIKNTTALLTTNNCHVIGLTSSVKPTIANDIASETNLTAQLGIKGVLNHSTNPRVTTLSAVTNAKLIPNISISISPPY